MDPFLLEREHDETPQSPRDHRHPTERDRDRILHSAAFRRLQGKTQVFGIGQADFYRTRLTHSIEAAQLARAIAHNLLFEEPRLASALTTELAEAVALAERMDSIPPGPCRWTCSTSHLSWSCEIYRCGEIVRQEILVNTI